MLFPCIAIARGNATGKVTLSGYVKDEANAETLIGAIISIKGTAYKAATNAYGFYSISMSPGAYTIEARYIGYQTIEKTIELKKDEVLNFNLSSTLAEMEEVVVSSDGTNKNVQLTQMGAVSVSVKSVKQLPALLGEADVVKTIQLLPGVSTVEKELRDLM